MCSLHLEARLGKWDSGVEASGLVVRVYPVDAQENIVPVQGTLEVELIAVREVPTNVGEPFTEPGRWCQVVLPEQVGVDGAVFRLPFQAVHPDFTSDLPFTAIVHGRLTVPGRGVFEDSADLVRIRSVSPARDWLQILQGTRWLPQEADWPRRWPLRRGRAKLLRTG